MLHPARAAIGLCLLASCGGRLEGAAQGVPDGAASVTDASATTEEAAPANADASTNTTVDAAASYSTTCGPVGNDCAPCPSTEIALSWPTFAGACSCLPACPSGYASVGFLPGMGQPAACECVPESQTRCTFTAMGGCVCSVCGSVLATCTFDPYYGNVTAVLCGGQ
jgi:hypothetical protein